VVCEPLVEHEDPVTEPVAGGGVDPPPPLLPSGIEHSFTDLLGIGSEPKVATAQLKLPVNTLNTNCPDAPKATFVEVLTEQDSPILQIVT